MADVTSRTQYVGKPMRLMGDKSSSVEGPVLYYEIGQFTQADNTTSGELATELTNVWFASFLPMNAAAITGAAYSDLVITSGAITITNTDPGGTAQWAYLLIGSIETV